NFYEHMDNPASEPALQGDSPESRRNREDLLVIPKNERIPQYMVDSREYIKAQLFRAAQSYRGDMHGQSAEGTATAFHERAAKLEERMPGAPVARGALRTTAIAQETATQVTNTPFQEITFEEADTITAPRGNNSEPGEDTALPTSGPAFHAEVDRRFWEQTGYKVNQRLDPNLPEDQPYVRIWLRIRNQVRAERQTARREREAQTITMPEETIHGRVPRSPTGRWGPEVADAMGRAGHALEDFFAHSNFVELAIGQPAPTLLYNPATGRVEAVEGQLGTGAFGANDKKHSLAHKVRALADEIESEMPLVNRVAGRTGVDPTPDQVHVGSEAPPVPHSHDDHEREGRPGLFDWIKAAGGTGVRAVGSIIGGGALAGLAAGGIAGGVIGAKIGSFLGPLGAVGGAVLGGLIGGAIGGIAGFFAGGGMEGLRTRIKETFRDVIATPQGVAMLRRIADVLERMTRADEEPGSHTALAKDQPGHDDSPLGRLRTIKFELAQELAAAADRMILGGMRQVFDAPSPESADVLLQEIYTQLNALIAPPGNHPLQHLIEHRREEAIQALEEYQEQLH
ncbi:HET-C-related protein, partial [Roseiflexus sp.]|uniref:HET-C-related protein n=2 Tax=Roseiflexus sp. TaxID=2562120 RepID=UPI00398AD80E